VADEVRLRLVVGAKVVPIREWETKHTLALVRQTIENLEPGVIKVLLMDRGFLDGADLWVLKPQWEIDFVVPAKEKMGCSGAHRAVDAHRGLCYHRPRLTVRDARRLFSDSPLGRVADHLYPTPNVEGHRENH